MPRRVLLIDDNLAVQKLVELTLRKEGYDVTSIDNGLSALDLAFKNQPDLILADYNLEGMNIFTFVQKIRQRGTLVETPIILLINSTESYDPAQLQSAGIQAFLKKPIDSRGLIQEVKRQSGAAETVPTDLNPVRKQEETSLSEHFSNPGNEAVKIEELLGWSSPGSLTEGSLDKVEAEQTILESAPPTSIESNSAPEEVGEETQFFTDQAVLQPAAPQAEPAQEFHEESLEETRYFQEPPQSSTPPPAEEPAPLEMELSLPDILPVPPVEEPIETDSLAFREASIPPISNSAPPVEEAPPMPSPSAAAPFDPSQINEVLRKNISEIVEKVVWEVLPGMLQSALPKSEFKAIIEKVAWETIPPLAEIEIKKEIKRLQEGEN